MSRIALVGAGASARRHAEALAALGGQRVTVVADPDLGAAERLARAVGAQAVPGVEAAIAGDLFDRAHVLVPPDRRGPVGEILLRAGKPVLLEAPMGACVEDCAGLLDAARGAALGVNLDGLHHPAFARLVARLRRGEIGEPHAIIGLCSLDLPQLAARRFGEWMFARPGNLLLERAMQPLAQLVTLAGSPHGFQALPGPAIEIAPGLPFVAGLALTLDAPIPAQLRFAVGESFPAWQITVAGSDGVAVADILNDRCVVHGRTRWGGAADAAASGLAVAGAIAWQSVRGLAGRPGGAGLRALRDSLGAFHAALDAGRMPEQDGHFGAALVQLCESVAAQVLPAVRPRPRPAPPAAPAPAEIAVLGGTGFIGTQLVGRLVAAGRRVVVMARNPANLPAVFDDPLVRVERGSILDGAAVARVIAGCRTVVNLVPGEGERFEDIRHAMVGGAETVARACRDSLARRLIHVGSIAALYLGRQRAPLTGRALPDPREGERAGPARAQALCERMLRELHQREGLPVVILRPGLVVGQGASPFHRGVGQYYATQHCIGWNRGRNPLPFVLVEDVAEAILRACDAEGIEGRCYNLVGDVRPSARDYTAMLAEALRRPLRFHPSSPTGWWLAALAGSLARRAPVPADPPPGRREFLSRGMKARFDCGDARSELGWRPNADAEVFRARILGMGEDAA